MEQSLITLFMLLRITQKLYSVFPLEFQQPQKIIGYLKMKLPIYTYFDNYRDPQALFNQKYDLP